MYHDKDLQKIHIPFLARSNSPVYGHTPIYKEIIEHQARRVGNNKLREFLKHILSIESIWKQHHFSDQLTILNDVLWTTIFGNQRGLLIYLEAESLVRKLLLDYHLDKPTVISQILFDREQRASYINHFDGISGAHTATEKGTHLFWYITSEGKRVQLWIKKSILTSANGQIHIPLEPEAIAEGLQQFSLLPSMALCYSILSFYYGLTLGGGFSQVQYLGEMKKAYERVIGRGKDLPVGRHGGEIRTDIFTGEFVAAGLSDGKKAVPATLIDMLLWTKDDIHDIINQQFDCLRVAQSLDLMMPEFVHIITGTRPTIADLPLVPATFYVE